MISLPNVAHWSTYAYAGAEEPGRASPRASSTPPTCAGSRCKDATTLLEQAGLQPAHGRQAPLAAASRLALRPLRAADHAVHVPARDRRHICSRPSDRDPLPGDPHALPRGPRQLLPDRRRPADAGRRRPDLGARRWSRSRPRCSSTAARSRSSSGSSSPTSTPTTSGWSASSPTAAAPRSARSTCCSRCVEDFNGYAERNDRFAQRMMRRHGLREDIVNVLGAMSRANRGWGGSAPVTRTLQHEGELGFASRSFQILHRPGHSPTDTVFFDPEDGTLIAGDHLIGHISLEPADRAAAHRRPERRAPEEPADLHRLARADASDADRRPSSPATATSFDRPRAADRRALRAARAPRGQAARA